MAAFLAWSEDVQEKPLTPYVLSVKGRELVEHHRQAFEPDLINVWSAHNAAANSAAFLESAVERLADWMVQQA